MTIAACVTDTRSALVALRGVVLAFVVALGLAAIAIHIGASESDVAPPRTIDGGDAP